MSGADDSVASTTFDVNDIEDAISDRGSDHNNSISTGAVIEKHGPRIGKDIAASGKDTPCLPKLDSALASSHSKSPSMTVDTAYINYGAQPIVVNARSRQGSPAGSAETTNATVKSSIYALTR